MQRRRGGKSQLVRIKKSTSMTRSSEGAGPEHMPAGKENAAGDLLMTLEQMLDLA